jgi:hypothetical protein
MPSIDKGIAWLLDFIKYNAIFIRLNVKMSIIH